MNIKEWFYHIRHLNALLADLFLRIEHLEAENRRMRQDLISVQETVLKGRKKQNAFSVSMKLMKKQQIKVAFLCEQQSLWKSFAAVVDCMEKDERFEVVLINLWCKEYGKDGSFTFRNPHMEEVCEGRTVVESYDQASDRWLDLEALAPDIVFFNRPYDLYRQETFHIKNVAVYAVTCYIPYGVRMLGGEVERMTNPKDFCKHLTFFFMSNSLEKSSLQRAIGDLPNLDERHLLYVGYPGLEPLRHGMKEITSEGKQILWLPRWNTSEGNCHFFAYKDVLFGYAKNRENCRLILRPHPLCFSNFLKTDEMTFEELETLKNDYSVSAFAELDESGDYRESFTRADILVADETSLLAEYFATGKPIIFCEKERHFSELMSVLVKGMYVVHNEKELIETLDALLRGSDPLAEERKCLIDRYLFDFGESAGENIIRALLSEFGVSMCEGEI